MIASACNVLIQALVPILFWGAQLDSQSFRNGLTLVRARPFRVVRTISLAPGGSILRLSLHRHRR